MHTCFYIEVHHHCMKPETLKGKNPSYASKLLTKHVSFYIMCTYIDNDSYKNYSLHIIYPLKNYIGTISLKMYMFIINR